MLLIFSFCYKQSSSYKFSHPPSANIRS
jgi:hypothetical protein